MDGWISNVSRKCNKCLAVCCVTCFLNVCDTRAWQEMDGFMTNWPTKSRGISRESCPVFLFVVSEPTDVFCDWTYSENKMALNLDGNSPFLSWLACLNKELRPFLAFTKLADYSLHANAKIAESVRYKRILAQDLNLVWSWLCWYSFKRRKLSWVGFISQLPHQEVGGSKAWRDAEWTGDSGGWSQQWAFEEFVESSWKRSTDKQALGPFCSNFAPNCTRCHIKHFHDPLLHRLSTQWLLLDHRNTVRQPSMRSEQWNQHLISERRKDAHSHSECVHCICSLANTWCCEAFKQGPSNDAAPIHWAVSQTLLNWIPAGAGMAICWRLRLESRIRGDAAPPQIPCPLRSWWSEWFMNHSNGL